MSLVPDAALTEMRAQRTESFRDVCVVTTVVLTGSPTPVTVACSVTPPKGSMDGGGGNTIARQPRFNASFPWGTVIKTGDRFTWHGKTLSVGQVIDLTTYSTAVHADCVEVTA